MGILDLRLQNDFEGIQVQAIPEDTRVVIIERRVRHLVHTSQCDNEYCIAINCRNMRSTIEHVKSCEKRIFGECGLCRYFTGLSNYHARQCQKARCLVFLCENFKKVRQQYILKDLHQAPRLIRNIASMQNCRISDSILLPLGILPLQPRVGSSHFSNIHIIVRQHSPSHPHQIGMSREQSSGPAVSTNSSSSSVQEHSSSDLPKIGTVVEQSSESFVDSNYHSPSVQQHSSSHLPQIDVDVEQPSGSAVGSNYSSPSVQQHSSSHPPQIELEQSSESAVGSNYSSPSVQQHSSSHPPQIGLEQCSKSAVCSNYSSPSVQHCSSSHSLQIDKGMKKSSGSAVGSNYSNPSVQQHSSSHPRQIDKSLEQSSEPISLDALQAVQQVQAAAAKQTFPDMVPANDGNPVIDPSAANTGLMVPNQQMQFDQCQPLSQMMLSIPNHMLSIKNDAPCENSAFARNPLAVLNGHPLSDSSEAVWQLIHLHRRSNFEPISSGNSSTGLSQIMPNPDFSRFDMKVWEQALKELLAAYEKYETTLLQKLQQNEIHNILRYHFKH